MHPCTRRHALHTCMSTDMLHTCVHTDTRCTLPTLKESREPPPPPTEAPARVVSLGTGALHAWLPAPAPSRQAAGLGSGAWP